LTAVRVIEPRGAGIGQRGRELWEYRWLIAYFGRRFLRKRYQRTWLGVLWLPLRPAYDVASRVFLFGGLLGVASGDRPYFMFFVVGSSAWHLFNRTAFWATRSLEISRSVHRRVYVPRLTALIGAIVPSVTDYLLYGVITIVGTLYFWIHDGRLYITVGAPLLVAAAGLVILVLFGLAIGLFTAVPGSRARDVRFTFNYLMGIWFYVTPVIYPISSIPPSYRAAARLNPVTAPIEMVKYGLLGTAPPPTESTIVCLVTLAVLLVVGLWVFGRAETHAADYY
jgi:lipopolysaccharide transport system permease protein